MEKTISPTTSIAFVTCVESGGLEEQTVRMVKSLRKWGGKFAQSPVYAVNPRFGAPLARSTHRAFDELGITFRKIRPANRYSWYNMINKPIAVSDVQEQADTDAICWLDSDILILGEPSQLMLSGEEDFAACCADKNIGTAADDDEYAPYFREGCRLLGLNFQELPWMLAFRENVRIRLYFNGGVFVYRRSSEFGRHYLDDCRTLMDARICSHESGLFFTEQMSLGLAMLKAHLRWRALPHTYNYAMGARIENQLDPAKLQAATILHYHDAMWPAFWPRLLHHLKINRPEVHDWLAPQGPLPSKMSPMRKVAHKLIGMARRRKSDRYQATCKVF